MGVEKSTPKSTPKFLDNDNKLTREYAPVILLTGGASGIGFATAKLLQSVLQYRVAVTCRASHLSHLKEQLSESERFKIFALDVTSEIERQNTINEINNTWGGIDILINNAGISYRAVVEHMTEQDELKQMSTNYLGPMALIRLVLPYMRLKGRGKIINISSVSGMLAMPTMASYSASKHALDGASEALWYECKPLGINVCLIQPGFIRSNSFQNVYYTEKSKQACLGGVEYSDYYQNMIPFVSKLMSSSRTSPEDVARLVLKVIQKQNPPLWYPATLDALIFYYIRRILPRRWLLPFLFRCLPRARHWANAYSKRR